MLESIQLKLPAASGGESSIFKEENNYIRSLTPGQAPGNALAERFNRGPVFLQNHNCLNAVQLRIIFSRTRKKK
jgi:hypothetical protein